MSRQKGYPGLQELQTYVGTTKHPRFDTFVGASKDDLSAWSMELSTSIEKELFETWSIRFACEIKQLKPHCKTNVQKKSKIDVHDDDQNSDQDNNDDQTNPISFTDTNRPLEEETTDGKINQLIFGMGFKKLANIPWNDTEKNILAQLKESLFLDVNMVLAPLIVQMLTTETNDFRFLKLCLSGIVNLMNTSQWNRVKPFLPQQKFPQLDELITSFKCHGMKDDSLKLFQDIATVCTSGGSENVLLAIDEFKKPLLRAKKTDQEAYRMLKILEHV
ncbi:hypothetical protein CLU79DRAFT_720158 [Phycomyces nitens]|nr:hypothetical protein CLU79DRAFT_720158 [Phycomyces nitens]